MCEVPFFFFSIKAEIQERLEQSQPSSKSMGKRVIAKRNSPEEGT